MLKRTVTIGLGIAVLALLAGDRLIHAPVNPGDRIFSKYKIKHESVRTHITAVGEELREILKTRPKAVAPRIYIALLTELARLKGEVALIESWENGTLNRSESVGLMADSLLVLEYLDMTAAYAKAMNEIMRQPSETRSLASDDTMDRAAREFPRHYEASRAGIPVFDDAEILAQSRESARLVPIAKALFDSPDPQAVVGYRVRFFSRYADNIISKNREKLQAFQQNLLKVGSVAPR